MITDAMRERWRSRLETIYLAVDANELNLSNWDTVFFEDVYERVIDQGQDLSWKQERQLSRIYGLIS